MLFLSIWHGVNSVKNHIFVYRFLRMYRKQKFQLDSSCMNKGLLFDILHEYLACMTISA